MRNGKDVGGNGCRDKGLQVEDVAGEYGGE